MISKLKNIGVVNILVALIIITFIIPPLILNPIFIGLLFVFVLIRYLRNKQTFYKDNITNISITFILYFVILVVSLIYSKDLNNGIAYVSQSFPLLIIPILPLFISRKEISLSFISNIFISFLCCIFFLLVFIAFYKNWNEGYSIEYVYQRLQGLEVPKDKYSYFNYWYFVYDNFTSPLVIQPIYLGLFTNIGIVFLFFLKKIKQIKYYYFKLIVLSVLILLTASRWQILIFALNFVIFILFFEDLRLSKKLLGITLCASFILLVSLINPVTKTRFFEAFSYKEAFYKDDFGSTSLRVKKWRSAINGIAKRPVIGYGVGDGKQALINQFKKDKFYLAYYNKYNAHNQYLDTLLYVGPMGLILLGFIFYFAYKSSVTKLYLFLITNIFFLGFITESILNRQWGVIAFPFFLIIFSIFDYETIEN